MKRTVLGTVAILCVVTARPGWTATIHVPVDQPTLAAAMAIAQPGDEVILACGTYHEHDVPLVPGVTLRSETRDPACVTIDADHLGRVLELRASESRTVIEGLTLRNGDAVDGGGIRIEYASATIRRCAILDCRAQYGGGAIFAIGPDLLLEDTLVARNHVWGGVIGAAGALDVANGTTTVRNCTVTLNTYDPAGGFPTGGVRAANGAVVNLDHSIVALNTPPQTSGWIDVVWHLDCLHTTDPLFCDSGQGDFSLSSASPCLPGNGSCTALIGAFGHGCGPVTSQTYTITTDPVGLPITVDGQDLTSPVVVTWEQWSEHDIAVAPLLETAPGTRLLFSNWSQGGESTQRVMAPTGPATFVASYRTEFQLAMPATPGGTTAPGPGWYAPGSSVSISAAPAHGLFLSRWIGTGAGSYNGSDNPASIRMDGPVAQVPRFELIPFEFSLSASSTDPHVNRTTATAGPRFVYLWLTCARNGLSAMEAGITGNLAVLGFEPLSGVLNAGTPQDLLLAVPDCPRGDGVDVLLGTFTVLEPAGGGRMCLGSAAGHGTEVAVVGAVDCDTVSPFYSRAPGVTGFTSDGSSPCRKGRNTCSGVPAPATEPTDVAVGPVILDVAPIVAPNPFAESVEIRFVVPREGRASVRIFDVAGRLVRSVLDERLPAGARVATWDGRTGEGRPAPAGVYFTRIETDGSGHNVKILRQPR